RDTVYRKTLGIGGSHDPTALVPRSTPLGEDRRPRSRRIRGLVRSPAHRRRRLQASRACGPGIAELASRSRRHAMTLPPSARKALLTTHVMSSVGWFGAVACFLILAIVGVQSASAEMVRGSYLAMQVLTWTLIVPLCLASLVTGILQSLGTPWGLLR